MRVHHVLSWCLAGLAWVTTSVADDFCGDVTGTITPAGGPHRATCDLRVPVGETLTLEADVVLRFTTGTSLLVEGALQVDGTPAQPVTLEPEMPAAPAGDWGPLRITGGADLTELVVRGASVTEAAGNVTARRSLFAEGLAGILVEAGATLGLTDCRVEDQQGLGVDLQAGTLLASLSGCLFARNQTALRLGVDVEASLVGLSASDHAVYAGVLIDGSAPWTAATTWSDPGLPFVIGEDTSFTTSLTLEPGVIVKVETGSSLDVAAFTAVATAMEPIVLTSVHDDTVGGDTDGPLAPPMTGDWGRFGLIGLSRLTDATVRHADRVDVLGDLTATTSRFEQGAVGAVVAPGGQAGFDRCSFMDNAGLGLEIQAGSLGTGVLDCDFVRNETALWLGADAPVNLVELTASAHRRFNGIALDGSTPWTTDQTWTDEGLPFVVDAGLTFAGATLTLEPGVVIKLDPAAADGARDILLDGIMAVGTPAAPVVFTSVHDDDHGGDTDGAAVVPAAGEAGRLRLGGTSVIEDLFIRYLDTTEALGPVDGLDVVWDRANVALTIASTGSASLRRCTLTESLGPGVLVTTGATGSRLDGCTLRDGEVPVRLEADSDIELLAPTSSGHRLFEGLHVTAGAGWTTPTTWAANVLPHVLTEAVTFLEGSSLTLEAGAVVKMAGVDAALDARDLVTRGTELDPAVVTHVFDDEFGGDTEGPELAGLEPTWGTLTLRGTNELTGLLVRDALSTLLLGDLVAESCDFERCGWGLLTTTTSQLELRQSTFRECSLAGLELQAGVTALVENCVFVDNARWGFAMSAGLSPALTSLTARGNGEHDGIELTGAGSLSPVSWTEAGIPYVVTADLSFLGGLELEPGVIVKLEDARLAANLQVTGLPDTPVLFTSLRDDTGGDTNGDGALSVPGSEDWTALELLTGTDSEHVEVRHARETVVTGEATVRSSLWTSNRVGVAVEAGGDLTLTDGVIDGNLDVGLELRRDNAGATITNTRLDRNRLAALLAPDTVGTFSMLTAEENDELDAILVRGGSWRRDVRWSDAGLPYVLADALSFEDATLTLASGALLKVDSGADPDLRFDGFVVEADSSRPAIVTSNRDDRGGDTNGDGGDTSPGSGDWPGLRLVGAGPHELTGLELAYASSGLIVDGTDVRVQDSRFVHDFTGMTWENGATGVVTDCLFHDDVVGVLVDATSRPDLGTLDDARDDNDGRNAFSCTRFLHVQNDGAEAVRAEGNWWGTDASLIMGLVDQDPLGSIGTAQGVPDLRLQRGDDEQDVLLSWMEADARSCSVLVLRAEAPDGDFVDVSGAVRVPAYLDIGAVRGPSYWYAVVVD
ncbi:MAG: right-handed parallel beta-helix repeat-containing protein [Acidobacteriota bacterium]